MMIDDEENSMELESYSKNYVPDNYGESETKK